MSQIPGWRYCGNSQQHPAPMSPFGVSCCTCELLNNPRTYNHNTNWTNQMVKPTREKTGRLVSSHILAWFVETVAPHGSAFAQIVLHGCACARAAPHGYASHGSAPHGCVFARVCLCSARGCAPHGFELCSARVCALARAGAFARICVLARAGAFARICALARICAINFTKTRNGDRRS